MSGQAINGQSYMMPEHDCYHVVAPDQSAVLQLVYSHGDAVTPPVNNTSVRAAAQELFTHASSLRDVFGNQLGKALSAKEKYSPNTVLMFIDITGFTRMSQLLGQKLSYDIVGDMQNRCIVPFLNKHDAVIFRAPEGDGLWIEFTGIDELGIDGILNERAMPLAQEIIKAYDALMAERNMPDYPLKITMSASEIDQNIQGDLFHAHIIHSGIGFFTVKSLAESVSAIQNGGQMQSMIALDGRTAKALDQSRFSYSAGTKIVRPAI